jgi:hypothetical protein
VAERPAVNASPLIFLSRAGLLNMLRLEGSEIVVPETVAVEIRRRGVTILLVGHLKRSRGSKLSKRSKSRTSSEHGISVRVNHRFWLGDR